MQTDTLIIGQGLCGTWLSFWLEEAGADYIVIDEDRNDTATKAASGIINPVTGRRMVKTWLADELLPFAFEWYSEMGRQLNQNIIAQTSLIDFFSAPDRRLSFEKRAEEFESYLNWPEDENEWRHYFNYPFGFGIVSPVYQVNLQLMLKKWKHKLFEEGKYLSDNFNSGDLNIDGEKVWYRDITARRIIFCDGVGVMGQPYFKMLPFAFNKGEALVINVPGLPQKNLYKKGSVITPWQDELFWVGSTYNRDYKDSLPSKEFYEETWRWLSLFLNLPFTVEEHLAAIRPTTVERRPFAGMHPQMEQVGILNGMGTKGVSLAPYVSKQLSENILTGKPIMKDFDVKQYAGILKRR
jgi:glycine/D-amino acid oxidase-like deaminating enzyme